MTRRINQVIKVRLERLEGPEPDWQDTNGRAPVLADREVDALAGDLATQISQVVEDSLPERTDANPVMQLIQGVSEKASDQVPWRISTRDLSRHTTRFLARLQEGHRTAVITYRGVPSFLVIPIARDDLFSLFLGDAPELREDHKAAREELASGEGTFYG